MARFKPSFYNIVVKEEENTSIVYNSVSGAIARFDSNTYAQLSNPNLCSDLKDADIIEKKGFLVRSDIDEWSKLFLERQCYIYNPNPVTLGFVIAPTLKCNLHCSYCFENDGRVLSSMNEATSEKTIEYIKKSVEAYPTVKDVFIVWFGGEPCLEIKTITKISREVIAFLDSKGIEYNARIATNGVLLTKDVAETLKECRVRSAQITMDGMSQSYAFRKNCKEEYFYTLVNNIIDICDIIKLNIRVNVDCDNQHEIPDLLDYLLSTNNLNGKINIYFAQIQQWNDEKDRAYIADHFYIDFLSKMHELILKNNWEKSFAPKRPVRQIGPCGSMHITTSTIDPNGDIYRCEHCLNKPEWRIGNVFEGKFQNSADVTFLNKPIHDKCTRCKAFPICAGGCSANEILHNIPAANCSTFIELIKENVLFAIRSKSKD